MTVARPARGRVRRGFATFGEVWKPAGRTPLVITQCAEGRAGGSGASPSAGIALQQPGPPGLAGPAARPVLPESFAKVGTGDL